MKIVFEGSQQEVIAEILAMATTLAPGKMSVSTLVPAEEIGEFIEGPGPRGDNQGADKPAERKPGFPAEGKTRRTKAQIAEDEAYFAEQEKGGGESTSEQKSEPEKTEETSGEDKAPTEDDVKSALKMVVDMCGMTKGKGILAEEQFGCTRRSELPESKFAAFIKRCNEATEE